jgi:hypothetical protein
MSPEPVKPSSNHPADRQFSYAVGSQIVNRYDVIGQLGLGGFSEVYHCSDSRLRREVAVKVIVEGGAGLNEARAAARLKHPHIVEVYDIEDAVMPPVIIFQYITGQTLEARLDQVQYRRLPLNAGTMLIIRQIAEAIDYAHTQKVIHRDIKPSNVILDQEGNAYLTDFGLAEVRMPEEPQSMLSAEMQKRFSGTLPYMSPEQIKEGALCNERGDIYSFGVVVYEMLTGRFPYLGRETQLAVQIATSEPQPPTIANPDLPKGIEPVLLQILSKDPQRRPASCQDFVTALTEASQAYVAAEGKYAEARQLFDARDWRKALIAFEALHASTPDFKDVGSWVEKSQQQVRLLELYERAHEQVDQGAYQDALVTLVFLQQLDPGYDVAALTQQAEDGKEQVNRRSLDELYQQAVQQYRQGEFEACVVTLDAIRSRQPNYPDRETIEPTAREQAEKQRRWRMLYNQGVEQMEREQWPEAVASFHALKQEAPKYKEVDNRLATARHLARLSALLGAAQSMLDSGSYAACVDKLNELQQLDDSYKQDDIIALRQQALSRLHDKVLRLLADKEHQACLAALAELEQRSTEFDDLTDLRKQADEGIRTTELLAFLDGQYEKAKQSLRQHDYAQALATWQAIQQKRGALEYPDPFEVETRAKEGLCAAGYNRALTALLQQKPEDALAEWGKVQNVDETYPDSEHVVQRAQELQAQRAQATQAAQARRERWRRWLFIGGAVVLGILLIIVCLAAALPALQTPPPTATPTATLTPSATPPFPTSTSLPTQTPMSTKVPTATPTGTPTVPLTPTAVAIQSSTIFNAPSADATDLGIVAPDEQVQLLGRYAVGQWLCVTNNTGVTGYVSAPRFRFSGALDALPAISCPIQGGNGSGTNFPATPDDSVPPLTMDFYPIEGTARCVNGKTYVTVYMRGQGGDGRYTYYWEGTQRGGPISDSVAFEIGPYPGAQIGKAKVVSGDGQILELDKFIPGQGCLPQN